MEGQRRLPVIGKLVFFFFFWSCFSFALVLVEGKRFFFFFFWARTGGGKKCHHWIGLWEGSTDRFFFFLKAWAVT